MTSNSKLIALTFDDGPNNSTTPAVLDKLEKHGVAATFFVCGMNICADTVPVVKRAYSMGCEIENHSKTHSAMNEMTAEQMLEELRFTSDAVEAIIGEPTRLFRPPYIAVNDLMFDTINLPFICGYGAEDWLDSVSAEQRSERILKQIHDGSIILLHDSNGNTQTVDALDLLIPALKQQGYAFTTVTRLFEAKGIVPIGGDRIIYSHTGQSSMYA